MTPSALLGPLLLALTATGQTPEPSPSPVEHTIYTVTPGISGFIAFFVLALIGWLLFRSLIKRMRKVDQAEQRRKRLEEESNGAQATAGSPEAGPADDEPGEGSAR